VIALEGAVELTHQLNGTLIVGTDDDAVGTHEIVDRSALLQELRIRHHGELNRSLALFELFGDSCTDLVAGTDRHRGLVDHDPVIVHVATDVARGRKHVLQIGRAVLIGRRTDGDELDGPETCGLLDVCRERKTPGFDVTSNHVEQPRLVNRNPALLEDADLVRIHIETEHVIADIRKARTADEPYIPRTDNRNLHAISLISAGTRGSRRKIEFLGPARRIGLPAATGRTTPVKLSRLEPAGVAAVACNLARMTVDQLLYHVDVAAQLRRRCQQGRLEQFVQAQQGRVATQLLAHQIIGRLGPELVNFPMKQLVEQIERGVALKP